MLDLPHFLFRLPVYWRQFHSDRLRWKQGLCHNHICLTDDISFHPGSDSLAFGIFMTMAFERRGYIELKRFLNLAEGCSSLLDVGASGGFFSALFASSRKGKTSVLSVEPDPISFAALKSVREHNLRTDLEWACENCGVGARDETIQVSTEGYGFSIAEAGNMRSTMKVVPLQDLCVDHAVRPDLMKFDVETMEYEIITESIKFIGDTRARIHLELHSPGIKKRKLDHRDVPTALYDIGYRPFGRRTIDKDALLKLCPPDRIVHLELLPSA